jgi:monoamine oxidase
VAHPLARADPDLVLVTRPASETLPEIKRATFDVIVVGAGLSGLVCATRLRAVGRNVLVLEARDRVGGRLLTGTLAGTTIDLGGQWMSVGQPRIAALAAQLGVRTFPQRRDGQPLFAIDDTNRIASAISRWRAAKQIERLAKHPPERDSTLRDWLTNNIRRRTAADLLAMHAELVFAMDASSISLLHYLHTFSRTGGFSPKGPDLPGGGREHRFVGGAQSLALALAAQLGDAVRLSSPVRSIVDDAVGAEPTTAVPTAVAPTTAASTSAPTSMVRVRTDDDELRAHRVVLALPPTLARKIDFPRPASFPPSRLGPVVKCFAAYRSAFWRADKLSGEAFRPAGDIRATVALDLPENAPVDGGAAVLLAFVVGEAAMRWHERPADERRDLVVSVFVEQFGERAAAPLDYTEVDWSIDPWSTGCVASLPPGMFAPASSWREPHGRIHFAGTESADAWPGYMEGAIEAGERAADEIIAARDS